MRRKDQTITVHSTTNVILGLFAGAAIGAALGMLFTPHKGSVLRSKIWRKGEDLSDEAFEYVGDQVEEMKDRISDKLDTIKSDLKSSIHERMRE